jgi:hypothetical protein
MLEWEAVSKPSGRPGASGLTSSVQDQSFVVQPHILLEDFMLLRHAPAAAVALSALALAACRTEKPASDAAASDSTSASAVASPASLSFVTITASDFKFEAPAEIPAGYATFRLVNKGPSIHHVQLVKLEDGKTADDFMAALKAGGPPPRWATMAGGPNPPEVGDTASATISLQPGSYAMVCFIPSADGVPHLMKGMVRPLKVTSAQTGAAEPAAQSVMKLVDYDFQLSGPLPAGRSTIRIENAGAQPHEVAIVRLNPGKKPMDFAEWGERQVGPAPGTLAGGVSAIMPGTSVFVNVDLTPGEYGLICFIPDMKDGKGHYHHGMAKKIAVAGDGGPIS